MSAITVFVIGVSPPEDGMLYTYETTLKEIKNAYKGVIHTDMRCPDREAYNLVKEGILMLSYSDYAALALNKPNSIDDKDPK